MASVQCKNCKYGIHYHGEPSGIEYLMIRHADWNKIISATFIPENKVRNQQKVYPKLYRTDTIPDDFPHAVQKFWKCPKCGTLLFFEENGLVKAEYAPKADDARADEIREWTGICFDDEQWDELTEAAFPDRQLPEKMKAFYEIFISDAELVLKASHDGRTLQYNRIM